MRLFVLAATVALALLPSSAEAGSAMEHMTITTGTGSHVLEVELVRSEPDMEKGLMFRHYMPENRGMLFDFRKPQMISMWMKNTYLSLDMVFIGQDGHVTHVAANAEPMSEAIISSEEAALGVLEINAGVAGKLGIHNGDVVHASIFPK